MWGGGAGASLWLELPLGIGTAKLACAEGFWDSGGVVEAAVPLTGSRSISIELPLFMAFVARADRRLRSSGGRFRGWVLGSILFRLERPGSVECRESLEDRDEEEGLVFGCSTYEAGREDFLGDLVGLLAGDEGSE